ncbi:MAG: carbohydrate ABC transporter permease [Lachnospiraceae bacterium]|nr:carbohydrate ABC transporter permease [Lachnospiraceae bacterium]
MKKIFKFLHKKKKEKEEIVEANNDAIIKNVDITKFSEYLEEAYADPHAVKNIDIAECIKKTKKKKKLRKVNRIILFVVALFFSTSFLIPTVLTIVNSFMSGAEINSNYGIIFKKYEEQSDMGTFGANSSYVSDKVNLKLIPDEVTFSQYGTVLLKSPDYLLKFWNSVLYVVPIVFFQIFIALGASYSFMRFQGKIKTMIFFIYIILMLMPFQVTLVPNYIVAEKIGTLNTVWAILLPGFFAPFSVYLLTRFMKRIPVALIEAAKIDGASELRIFFKICVPLCKSAIASVAILLFIDYWNMVEQPVIMLDNSDKYPLSVFLSQINNGETGLAFAVATIYMIPTILMFLHGEEYLIEGISYTGGVKG